MSALEDYFKRPVVHFYNLRDRHRGRRCTLCEVRASSWVEWRDGGRESVAGCGEILNRLCEPCARWRIDNAPLEGVVANVADVSGFEPEFLR